MRHHLPGRAMGVMPDFYYYRDAEEIEKEEAFSQAAAEKVVTKEEFQGEWSAAAPEFTATHPEVADRSKGGAGALNLCSIPTKNGV